ncbi:MAG: hypothetical protein DME44_13665 [Verrucomicrobia bacterium]|nr:MAG: hypothetical protein DME44_13665 [Verrucomicrobiota bacterium]
MVFRFRSRLRWLRSADCLLREYFSAGHILKLPVPCGSSNGCVAVASDPSSRFTGIPNAFFGVVAYIVILCLFMFWTEYTGHVLR